MLIGVLEVAKFESKVRISKNKIADPIWPKNGKNRRVWLVIIMLLNN